ncbi:hypothetical protein R5W24_000408 [Gemmata sp. JC717]|uniref:hypothetical protein n=1 Tax=Gemmata algarum TaxID=2975278 RepID=UPI0021BA952C|nr:hypothetical protein [Gemmata algarum]MDY3551333.1 hypothetical protein [Gemmata algarum]
MIDVLTNLPAHAATAGGVAELYRGRWTVEALFYRLTMILGCEVDTLGYPPAALFGFCVALASSNAYAMVRAAVRGEHGDEAAENLSDFYVAAELERTAEGMGVAVPGEAWDPITAFPPGPDRRVAPVDLRTPRLDRYQKAKRGQKKPKPRRTRFAAKKHVATSRLISGEQK